MTLVEIMRAKVEELAKKRADQNTLRGEKKAALDSLNDGVQKRGASALTEDESTRLSAIMAEIKTIDADLVSLDEQRTKAEAELAEFTEAETKAKAAEARAKQFAPPKPGAPHVEINTENERTYTRNAERRGVSFLRDLVNRMQDPIANDRLLQHQREATVAGEVETRDVGTGAFTGLVVPQYLTELVAPLRRAGRPTADICNIHELPEDGMTVNISRITTGTAAAIQATENAAVQETDADDTLLTVNVRTIAGQQDVSRQAIDRGTGIDQIIIADLVRAYNTTLDSQIINADGTSGTHLGIRSTTSIVAVTWTDASPTAAELYPKLADVIQQIQSGVFMGVSHFVVHPRRWWWIASQLSSTFPLLQFPGTAPQVAGNLGDTSYESSGRNILGIPVVLDGNIPTNLGTNEDVILGVTAAELHLWEDPNAPLLIRAEQTAAGNLSVKLVVYGYSAFSAGRYPGAHGALTGSGLILPVF